MAINLKSKTQRTSCGGELHNLINIPKGTTTVNFVNVIENPNVCPECPYLNMCPLEPASTHKTILVKAFTGMPIGNLPIIRETKTFLEVQTKQGQIIRFDRKSGVQTNCTNSRYANRIDAEELQKAN